MLATGPVRWYATEKAMETSSKRSLSPKKASPDLVSKNSASRKNKQQAIKNSQKTDPRPTRIKKTSASNSAPYECNCTMEGPRGKGISHLETSNADRIELDESAEGDIVFIVKIKRSTEQVYVDFGSTENDGDVGPFQKSVRVEQLLTYYQQWKTDSDSEDRKSVV